MVYIFLALLLYTAAILFGAAAARNANTTLVTALNNIVSAIIPIAIAIPLIASKTLHNQKYGLVLAGISGIFVSLFVLALNKSFLFNKVAVVIPVVFGGMIFLTAVLSAVIFKEKIGTTQGVGLLVLGLGLVIIIYARVTAK